MEQGNQEVTPSRELQRLIGTHHSEGWPGPKVKVIRPDLAVIIDSRTQHTNVAGVDYWSQVHVLFGTERQMQEWRWRDGYTTGKDRHDLHVDDIGKVLVNQSMSGCSIDVELVNEEYGNRTVRYEF